MHNLLSRLLLAAAFVVTFFGLVSILGAREIVYQYHHNGHSLNPLKYSIKLPKINLGHPFWHGRYSARHV